MTITYFFMLLFVFWTAVELRYFGMKLLDRRDPDRSCMIECAVYGALATYFFYNVW